MNPYSEIDIARGSTLIILITSSNFRMTHIDAISWTLRIGEVTLVLTGPQHAPSLPTIELVEINKSIGEKKTGTDRRQRRVHFYNGDLFCVNVRHVLFWGEAAMAQNQQSYSTLHDSNTTVCTNKVLINEIFTMEQV